jgi:transcriptional regulator with XRE-family HTH domain
MKKVDPAKLFGATVRKLREREGISQEDFAEKCGLRRTYIGSVERGERNVSLTNIVRIASAFGEPAAVLLEGL